MSIAWPDKNSYEGDKLSGSPPLIQYELCLFGKEISRIEEAIVAIWFQVNTTVLMGYENQLCNQPAAMQIYWNNIVVGHQQGGRDAMWK